MNSGIFRLEFDKSLKLNIDRSDYLLFDYVITLLKIEVKVVQNRHCKHAFQRVKT